MIVMRLHTDTLTTADIYSAAEVAGARVLGASVHGSRQRHHAIEVGLSGSGRRGGQWGNTTEPSATWDEWGLFLAELFRRDPRLSTRDYSDPDHFRWSTGGRYDDPNLTQHVQHKWAYQGRAVAGSYYVAECKCGAVRRWLAPGHTWAELAA